MTPSRGTNLTTWGVERGVTTYYHTTDRADEILTGGFRDATRSYMCWDVELTGVWLSDRPLDSNEGCKGDQVLRVELNVDLEFFELVEEYKPYREWCVPAALINEHATVTR